MSPKRKVKEMNLMELPRGTPEVVPIVCNGVPGYFVVRTKSIVNEHFREEKVTLFAKATGTTNPWKTAVHIAAVGRQAGTVMSKWLNERHITSPLLSELTRNARECGWHRPLLPGELASKSSKRVCHGIFDATEESQASGAASFLSSSPSRLTHSDMGPPAHKTVSLQELATGKPGPSQAAPRVRCPIRTASLNGAPEKGDSPAQEQAASNNDAGSHIESECVTPHNQLKGQRMPWASPPGTEASTPGALLYHDRTPASPLNMLLLNRQPAQHAQQIASTQEAQPQAADPPHPPQSPTRPSALQNGSADKAQPQQHAKDAAETVVPQPLPVVSGSPAKKTTEGNTLQTEQPPRPATDERAMQASERADAVAAGSIGPTAAETHPHSSPTQPAPARKPAGKGFLGVQIPGAQQVSPNKSPASSLPNQPTEHQNSPVITATYSSTRVAPQPGGMGNGPSASPAQTRAGQPMEAGPEQRQEPAINKNSKQSTQTMEADEKSRQSPELEIASVHQAVETVQGIVDAVAPEQHQSRDEILVRTPDISPNKLVDAGGHKGSAPQAAKKQHATPPIKDIRSSSLPNRASHETAEPSDAARLLGQPAASHAIQGAEALPAPVVNPTSPPPAAAMPGSKCGTPDKGVSTPATLGQPSTKRKLPQHGPSDEAVLRQMMAKKFKGLSEAKQARQALEAELAEVRGQMAARIAQLEAERDATAAQAQAANQEAASSADQIASMKAQLSEMEQKMAAASQTEASAKLEISKVRQEALQAKQSMFARHSTAEKTLREHRELLAAAREDLAGQKSLVETLRANAKNLRQQIGTCKKEKEDAEESLKKVQAACLQAAATTQALQATNEQLAATVRGLESRVLSAEETAKASKGAAAVELEAATKSLKERIQQLQAAAGAADTRAAAAEKEAASTKAFVKSQADQLCSARAEAASYKKEAMSLVDRISQLDKSAKEGSAEHAKALQAAEAKAAKAEEARKLALQGCKKSEESRRKAQEELAGASKAEKAAHKTVAALEKDLGAAVAKAKEQEAAHARALQAAEARSKQAGAEALQLREKHTAQIKALETAHAAALQQQKSSLEQQLAEQMAANMEELRSQIRIEIMQEIVEDPEFSW